MLRHSLRFRITVAFCVFGTILSIIFGMYIHISSIWFEDDLFNRHLELEIDNYLARSGQDPDTPFPNFHYTSVHIGTETMSSFERDLVKDLGEGFHEWEDEGLHIAVKTLPDGKTLYLFHNTAVLEIHKKYMHKIAPALIAGLIVIVAIGVWLGLVISRLVIAPIVRLGEYVKKAGPEKLPTNLSQRFYDDEVGLLARTLEQAMKRIEDFVDREKQFTRDASHELRTPVTVIKGALDVIKSRTKDEPASFSRPLQRIERAARDMENIIETLLWLSREDEPLEEAQPFTLASLVEEAVDQEKYLLKGKAIETHIIKEADPVLTVNASALKLAAANLIRNAFQYTMAGDVTIFIRADHVEVTDTGAGIPSQDLEMVTRPHHRGKESPGLGLGLNIVDRLCRRFNWRLDIESELSKGTRVKLYFSNP